MQTIDPNNICHVGTRGSFGRARSGSSIVDGRLAAATAHARWSGYPQAIQRFFLAFVLFFSIGFIVIFLVSLVMQLAKKK